MLRASAAASHQLPQEEVRAYESVEAEEEAKVDVRGGLYLDEGAL